MVYFWQCENIDFQDKEGNTIWSAKGKGQIRLPAFVGVYVVRGVAVEEGDISAPAAC